MLVGIGSEFDLPCEPESGCHNAHCENPLACMRRVKKQKKRAAASDYECAECTDGEDENEYEFEPDSNDEC